MQNLSEKMVDKHIVDFRSKDSKTIIYSVDPIKNQIKLNNPVLIVGFPSSGLLGTICINYIVDKLKMKQISCVDSEYIVPGVIYFRGLLKHSFRIYANDDGTLCALICESPIFLKGIHSITDSVIQWCNEKKIADVVVLGGIETIHNPTKRETIILSSSKGNGFNLDSNENGVADFLEPSSFIGGIYGGIISSCLSHNIPCTALFTTTTISIPDPEGAALLIEAMAKTSNKEVLKINTDDLRKESENLRKILQDFVKSLKEQLPKELKESEASIYT
ncbi:MAG: hypothetical protein DA328_06230 [Nitrososphaeraceae archaeon]|nr:hypothetical protein [Nitrososphaeraceae archaeon]